MRLYSVIEGLRRAATNDHPWIATPAEAGVLVAEMERLRAESATFRRLLAEAVQTSADLCPECGWRFLVPDNGCQKCELDRFRAQREELATSVVALQRKLAELETDVAYAMRRALAPVGAA